MKRVFPWKKATDKAGFNPQARSVGSSAAVGVDAIVGDGLAVHRTEKAEDSHPPLTPMEIHQLKSDLRSVRAGHPFFEGDFGQLGARRKIDAVETA